jgi:hypothetical protein
MDHPELKNIRLQFCRWEDMPAEMQEQFISFMAGNRERGQALYEMYFYWYNIPHEIGHVLRALYNSYAEIFSRGVWGEETAVNQFAVSYWRAKGQTARLLKLENELHLALNNMPDPVPANEDRAVYLNNHYRELTDPSTYGHYQFNMVRYALAHPFDFSQALKTLVTPKANDGVTIPLSPDFPIDEDLPYRTIDDMRKTLLAYGIHLPDIQIICMYSPSLQFVTWDSEQPPA